MKRALTIGLLGLTLSACSSPSEPVTPPTPPMNPHEIIDGFTRDLWPVIAAFNADPEPIHKPYEALAAIMADRSADHSVHLYIAAGDLGYPLDNDRDGVETMNRNDGLRLRAVDVHNLQHDSVDLNVCYTYTHYWDVRREGVLGDSRHAPGASEATFGLYNRGGTWMLYSISGDHVVPDCVANKA